MRQKRKLWKWQLSLNDSRCLGITAFSEMQEVFSCEMSMVQSVTSMQHSKGLQKVSEIRYDSPSGFARFFLWACQKRTVPWMRKWVKCWSWMIWWFSAKEADKFPPFNSCVEKKVWGRVFPLPELKGLLSFASYWYQPGSCHKERVVIFKESGCNPISFLGSRLNSVGLIYEWTCIGL